MFLGSLSSFVMIWSQASENVHNVRNVYLRKCLCVLMCLGEFYVFIFLIFLSDAPITDTTMFMGLTSGYEPI